MAAPEEPTLIALDSCEVIHALDNAPQFAVQQGVITYADAHSLQIAVSTMVLVEARGQGKPSATGKPFDHKLETEIKAALTHPRWLWVELDTYTALKARELAIEYGMNNADAVHLASAIMAGADVLLTGDHGYPLDTTVEGVYVTEPYALGLPGLFPNP